jgi:hypothetical protein
VFPFTKVGKAWIPASAGMTEEDGNDRVLAHVFVEECSKGIQ